jgi:hypothetical protein
MSLSTASFRQRGYPTTEIFPRLSTANAKPGTGQVHRLDLSAKNLFPQSIWLIAAPLLIPIAG